MEERLHGGNQISDKFVIVDFERAIHNALLEIFSGCYCAGKLYVVPGLPNDQCFPVWAPFKEGIRQFLTYFEETWVGDAFAGTDPLFSPTMWSGYRTLMDRTLPSTQGGSEAYNYAFRRLVIT